MAQRLVRRDGRELPKCALAERPAGRGHRDARYVLHALADQALPQRAVLAVHRTQALSRPAGERRDEVSAGDEHLLVRQRHALAGAQGRERRREPRDAGRRDQHEVHVVARREIAQRVVAVALLQHHRDGAGLGRERLERGGVARRRKRGHTQAVAVGPDDIERLNADRAGRAQDREACHHLTIIPPAASGSAEGAPREPQDERDRGRDQDEAVDAVEHATVAREHRPRVLGARGAFDR